MVLTLAGMEQEGRGRAASGATSATGPASSSRLEIPGRSQLSLGTCPSGLGSQGFSLTPIPAIKSPQGSHLPQEGQLAAPVAWTASLYSGWFILWAPLCLRTSFCPLQSGPFQCLSALSTPCSPAWELTLGSPSLPRHMAHRSPSLGCPPPQPHRRPLTWLAFSRLVMIKPTSSALRHRGEALRGASGSHQVPGLDTQPLAELEPHNGVLRRLPRSHTLDTLASCHRQGLCPPPHTSLGSLRLESSPAPLWPPQEPHMLHACLGALSAQQSSVVLTPRAT